VTSSKTTQEPKGITFLQFFATALIYYGHLILMIIYFFSGFFVPLPWILVIYLATETLVKINNNRCPVTTAQEKIDTEWDGGEYFLSHLSKKYFNYKMSERQQDIAAFLINVFPLYIALLKLTILHFIA